MARPGTVGYDIARCEILIRDLGYDITSCRRVGGRGGGTTTFFVARSHSSPYRTWSIASHNGTAGLEIMVDWIVEDWEVAKPADHTVERSEVEHYNAVTRRPR